MQTIRNKILIKCIELVVNFSSVYFLFRIKLCQEKNLNKYIMKIHLANVQDRNIAFEHFITRFFNLFLVNRRAGIS